MNYRHDLLTIMTKEIDIYTTLLQLEEQKKEAIVGLQGDRLFSLSKEQESCILALEKMELNRKQLVKKYSGNSLHSNEISLSDFIKQLQSESADDISAKGAELKGTIERFVRLYETNKKLINDNIDFFNVIVSSLRKAAAVETGYGPSGLSERSTGASVIMNKTV